MRAAHLALSAIEGAADLPPDHRCRLCSANDVDGLIDYVAEQLWESRRHGTLDDLPWPDCGPHWQRIFRELADTAVTHLR